MISKAWAGDWSITQVYGPTNFVLEPTFRGFAHFHKGLDVGMPEGTELYAYQDGTCSQGIDIFGGKWVFIANKDGTGDLYAHIREAVKTGTVKSGELIAHSGKTGNSTGAHLHFEHRTSNTDLTSVIDPLNYLKGVQVNFTVEEATLAVYHALHRPPTPDDIKRYTKEMSALQSLQDLDKTEEYKRISDVVTVNYPKLVKLINDIKNFIG